MQTLIVTGATGGLGSVVVRQLGAAYDCVALYRGTPPEGVRGVQADLSDPAAVRSAIGSIAAGGAPYGLVHLAGGYAGGSLADTTDETWSHMLSLNLTAAFVAIRETLAVMNRDAAGRIVVIGSDAARTKAPGNVAYTVAKSALNALIEQVAQEVRGTGITANALLPSALDTPAMRGSMPPEKLVPLPRVAATIEFLLSEAAANINGALIPLTAP
jgi:NAD(P)-dependent dehydrogenase (short-subunit alcohol dehydrogenase family)